MTSDPEDSKMIRIDRMLYGGAGTDSTGNAVFPFTLPGELVELDGTASLTILEPSPNRVAARCAHFGACGGCHYQHTDAPTQLAIKRAILLDLLGTLPDLPAPTVHAAAPWHYRNRIRMRFAMLGGQPRVGYNRRGSVDFLPIGECPISAPLLLRAAEALLSHLNAAWQRQLVELELFTTPDETRLQAMLFVRAERGLRLDAVCTALARVLPELTGAGIVVVGASGRQAQPGQSWGSPGLQYRAAARDYWVPRGSFFQGNRFLLDDLVRLVTAGRSGTLAWDLYAGVGLFSRPLADTFTKVVSVEVATLPGTSAIASTTAAFLQTAVLQRDRPNLIVVDPPRAGLGPEVCALLARIRAPELVYVSCDPTTLARDLSALVDSGYTIHELHLVDLFPQTFHLETVVMLHR